MKKWMLPLLTIALSVVTAFSGCIVVGEGGKGIDGKDGQDLSIYDIYQATNQERIKEGMPEFTFLEFIQEYLKYDNTELLQATSLSATINRSLLSTVAVTSRFAYTESYVSGFGFSQSVKTINYHGIAQGSGVILDLDKTNGNATIVTNCHVVYDASATQTICPEVNLFLYGTENSIDFRYSNKYTISNSVIYDYTSIANDYSITAKVVGLSISHDIAVLSVENSSLIKRSNALPAEWSMDEDSYIGEAVYAVGNAAGEGIAATTGIVSRDSEYIALSLDDKTESEYRVVRTDTAINGGNSGGGLYNYDGKLVGIVNAKDVSEEIENMGYALPASTVRRVVARLLANANKTSSGSLTTGFSSFSLGIDLQVDHYTTMMENDRVVIYQTLSINSLQSGSVASQSGLARGDVLVSIAIGSMSGGSFIANYTCPISREYHLSNTELQVKKGDCVQVVVLRNGTRRTATIQNVQLNTNNL